MINNSTSLTTHVSVVIPTSNRPTLLCRALESVFNQTLSATSYEVIVVDDCSDDDILSIIKQYPVIYHRNANKLGGGATRNVGIQLARGKYIAFLDDDDEWQPEKLQVQLSMMENYDYEITSTGYNYVDEKGALVKKFYGNGNSWGNNVKILISNYIGTTSSVMIKKDVLVKYGGFDTSFEALQDYDLWTNLLLHNVKYYCINKLLVLYHLHKNERISLCTEKVYLGSVRYYFKYYKYIQQEKLRRYWLAYLVRLKADIYRPLLGEKVFQRSILKSFLLYKKNIKRLVLYCYRSILY